jgi:hypothetical protein
MRALVNNAKNVLGWRTRRKLIVFAVDDYGNVRVHSKKARQAMNSAGLRTHSRFDAFDTLETREDLEMLLEVLTSVRDKEGHPAIFTAYALPCNINFYQMKDEGYQRYVSELLPDTFAKLTSDDERAYGGAWPLWKEGMKIGILVPEFHGREHLNIRVLEEKLVRRDGELMVMLENRSFTSMSYTGYPTIKYTAAFAFDNDRDLASFPKIMKSGLDAFQTVYGINASLFTPPAHQYPISLEPTLHTYGLNGLDKPFVAMEHTGKGEYRRVFRWTGYKREKKIVQLVRNAVFEPSHKKEFDWVGSVLKEIEIAFRWNRPAIVSSHRVNFCGHVDPKNRKTGLTSLKTLLQAIVKRWPDVEFVSAKTLSKLVHTKREDT